MTVITSLSADVIIFDKLDPESAAMVLALYSRDPQSVRVHLERVAKQGAEKFMAQYYVGYGHKSIGDCGSTTICAEQVSMLAAKAIQDNPLYNGQEASTRYLDMASQPVLNPLGTEEGLKIQERWMTLYSYALKTLVPHLMEKYPMLESDNGREYPKAIKAKAFDIARAFLPTGCTTYVGWHTNLRQAWDHTKEMMFHPLEEVRHIGSLIEFGLHGKYPNSFGFKSYAEQDEYGGRCAMLNYHDDVRCPNFDYTNTIGRGIIEVRELLATRPQKTELPDWLNKYGQFNFRFLLDFGSFRDLQRHRSCTQLMPLLTVNHGFNSWYLDELPIELRAHALQVIDEQEKELEVVTDPLVKQYYVAMGYNVTCDLTAGLPSAVYIAELRSGQAVHPTLRVIAQKMGRAREDSVPSLVLHCDNSPDEWSTVRGKHDIVKK